MKRVENILSVQYLIKGIAFIFFISIMISSCSNLIYHDWATNKYGKVIKITDQQVCVQYKVMMGNGRESKKPAYNCYFHGDGHYYELGDIYPNFDKHKPNLFTEV